MRARSMHRIVLLGLWVLSSCKKDDPTISAEGPYRIKTDGKKKRAKTILDRYPIRKHMRWTEVRDDGGFVVRVEIEDRWTPIEGSDPPAWSYWRHEIGTGVADETAYYELRPEGFVVLRSERGGQKWEYTPPKLLLPADLHVGSEWKADHTEGVQPISRSCRVEKYDECEDGLVVRCTTTTPSGLKLVVDNRQCGGIGASGYVSTAETLFGKRKVWSEDPRDLP